jgi:hypothetical protein
MDDKLLLTALLGLTKEAAERMIQDAGFTPRMVCNNGKYFMVTRDLRRDRVNLTIQNNLVVKVDIG